MWVKLWNCCIRLDEMFLNESLNYTKCYSYQHEYDSMVKVYLQLFIDGTFESLYSIVVHYVVGFYFCLFA